MLAGTPIPMHVLVAPGTACIKCTGTVQGEGSEAGTPSTPSSLPLRRASAEAQNYPQYNISTSSEGMCSMFCNTSKVPAI